MPAMTLAMALWLSPAIAAEKAEAAAPTPSSQTKSAPEPGKPDDKAAGKPDKKGGDDSGGKPADETAGKKEEKADQKPEGGAEAENKADDPCDSKKQLFPSDFRDRLCKAGLRLGVTETSEVLGNFTGGRHRGVIYEGLTDLNADIDFRPSLHVRGDLFARAYQIHGRGLTTTIGNLNEISGIEAAATTRLAELWYEQRFEHWLRIRIGQQTIGNEFLSPESARLLVNGAFGWPTLPSLDLPSGGPGFPLGTPAIRARIDPFEGLTLFTALFNGDPTGAGVGGSQLADASGTAFRIGDGAFFITELRYNPESSDKNGTYRFGGWYNSERFRDLRFATNGLPLASPASSGQGRLHEGDYSLYAIVDQPFLYDEKSHTSFSVFARAMGAPSDRNLIDFSADAGIAYKGPFGRADDQVGLAVAYVRVGNAARGFDADLVSFTGLPRPIRSGETVLEATYRLQLTPWWQLQPDFQYVFNPGGGVPSLSNPMRRVGDAAVFGLRTAITF
jgi:porin